MSLSIGIVGAGFSGLCAAVQLKKRGFQNFTICDEHDEVGGTWLANKYPGCACDIPSHLYSFSFEPNPSWSQLFSPQPEILEYAKGIAKKYELYSHIHFNTQAIRAEWIGSDKQWEVTTKNMKTGEERIDRFDIVFSGIGGLRIPKIPQEFLSFKGPRMHSAQWDSTVDIKGKTVGIVGSGASAIQIIPSIAADVKELVVFQRKPAWIVPRPQFSFPQWAHKTFSSFPLLQMLLRLLIFLFYEATYAIYFTNSIMNRASKKIAQTYLKYSMGKDEEMRKKLEPNYPIGCKRIAPHTQYYASLRLPHVQLVTSRIEKVSEHSITTEDGLETKLDVLILATGFNVEQANEPLRIIGADGVDIVELWKSEKEGPSTYHGIVSSTMPNCFLLVGPNSAPGHTSALFSIECQVNWSLNVMEEMIRRGCKEVRVKEEAQKRHMKKLRGKMKRTVWVEGCGNWYVNKQGAVVALNPVSGISYWWSTRKPDWAALSFN